MEYLKAAWGQLDSVFTLLTCVCSGRYDANPTDGSPPRGEILIRGPGVFRGYYKAETMSKEVIGRFAKIG